jgi:signal transduction histidine kinase
MALNAKGLRRLLRLPDGWRWPGLAFFRLRLFFRGVFLLLALATLAIAANVLQDEKQLAYATYRSGFAKTVAQVATQLRHPAGQLALLNPPSPPAPGAPPDAAVHPLLLPFSALDFDDRDKARAAAEMSGCLLQYPDDASLCVAVGSNAWAGGFVYVIGTAASPALVSHARGQADLSQAHRMRVTVDLRGRHYQWLAPFEGDGSATRGHLAGFREDAAGTLSPRPERDFRGWMWQSPACLHGDTPETCARRTYFSLRLPVEIFRDDLLGHVPPVWPPADLNRVAVGVQFLAPGDGPALFDSRRPGATPPFALGDLGPLLLPGETLQVRRAARDGTPTGADIVSLVGAEPAPAAAASWLPGSLSARLQRAVTSVIRRLPIDDDDGRPIDARESIRTAAGTWELHLAGDVRGVHRALAAVVTRLSWIVGAMLLALALAWLAIEWAIIRRITVLTRRARALSAAPPGDGRLAALDVADLRGPDELGVLAEVLDELLQRVNESVRRERIRAEQEKDQWMAVGHEIMSPLQSLIALHGGPDDASRRYIERMQQAVRVLYGSASPSEAFQSTTLRLEALDLDAFLAEVARNAAFAGIADVRYDGPGAPVPVNADAYSLEDVVTHVLQNAQAHRREGTPIGIALRVSDGAALVTLHNVGEPIPGALVDRVFEYGVSGAADRDRGPDHDHDHDHTHERTAPHRGQGLFVAKTYMAKMGGTIAAHNVADGVVFELRLPLAAAA